MFAFYKGLVTWAALFSKFLFVHFWEIVNVHPCTKFHICKFSRFGDIFEGVPNFIRVMWPSASFLDFYLTILEKLSISMLVLNFTSVALVVLEICLRVCQILKGSRDPGHVHFPIFYLTILKKLSACIPVRNFKSVALFVLEICLRVCQIL